jgi:glycosyltransferase involved in cell wall biosynthesis
MQSLNGNFDICIPAYNSLEYLKKCVESIQKNSTFGHRIYVHDNGSTDGTEEWLKSRNDIVYTRSATNEGFCAVNNVLKIATAPYIMIFNCDMYVLPDWDLFIYKQIVNFVNVRRINKFTISCSLIEPVGHNPEYIIRDFGTDISGFRENQLLDDFYRNRARYLNSLDTIQYSHPILLPRTMLHLIGYMDPAYFPGWASDHDLAAGAFFTAHCRDFVMLGKSKVYHFSSKTFQKLPEEIRNRHGQDIFRKKWGMSADEFRTMINIRKVLQ